MAIPSSGQIRMSDIGTEFGISISNLSLKTLSDDTGSTSINTCSPSYPDALTPHQMSEWWSYDHSASCDLYVTWHGYDSEHDSCRFIQELNVYITGSNALLNHTLYTNVGLTNVLSTGHLIFGHNISASYTTTLCNTDNAGEVTLLQDCGSRVAFKMSESHTKALVCTRTLPSLIAYHGNTDVTTDQAYRFPVIGDFIYTSPDLRVSTKYIGNNEWYKLWGKRYDGTSVDMSIQISNGGEVIDFNFCATLPYFDIDLYNYRNISAACSGSAEANQGRHSGYGEVPAIGDYVFDPGMTSLVPGFYYCQTSQNSKYIIEVSSNGVVLSQHLHCSDTLSDETISLKATDADVLQCSYNGGTQLVDSTTQKSRGFEVGEFLWQNGHPFRGAHGYWHHQSGGDKYFLKVEDTGLIVSKTQC